MNTNKVKYLPEEEMPDLKGNYKFQEKHGEILKHYKICGSDGKYILLGNRPLIFSTFDEALLFNIIEGHGGNVVLINGITFYNDGAYICISKNFEIVEEADNIDKKCAGLINIISYKYTFDEDVDIEMLKKDNAIIESVVKSFGDCSLVLSSCRNDRYENCISKAAIRNSNIAISDYESLIIIDPSICTWKGTYKYIFDEWVKHFIESGKKIVLVNSRYDYWDKAIEYFSDYYNKIHCLSFKDDK